MLMNEGGQGEEIREVGATTGPVCKRQPPLSSVGYCASVVSPGLLIL